MLSSNELHKLNLSVVDLIRRFGHQEVSLREMPPLLQQQWNHHVGEDYEVCGYTGIPREALKHVFMMRQYDCPFTDFGSYHDWYRGEHGGRAFQVYPLLINIFDDDRPVVLHSEERMHDYVDRITIIPTIHRSIGEPRWKRLG